MAVLSQMTTFPKDIQRRYGELVSDAAKNGEAFVRKGKVQRKFEDYVFKADRLESMVGFNSGLGLGLGLHEKKAMADLKNGMRSVQLQFDELARVSHSVFEISYRLPLVKMNEHPTVTLPSFQVGNKKIIVHMVAKIPSGNCLAIPEMGVVDWEVKSLDTALKAAMYFYSCLVSIRNRWLTVTYTVLDYDAESE